MRELSIFAGIMRLPWLCLCLLLASARLVFAQTQPVLVHDFNGTIPEKYCVVTGSHDVFVEYGNVGTKFSYIAPEGFGWVNASLGAE